MGEMWKEIRKLREQVGSRVPVPKKGSPFLLAILKERLPPHFRQSNVGEYDRHTDTEEHLGRFENAALLHQYSDGVRCMVFLGTLVSIKRHQKNYLSLFVMKQQEDETLREFVQRFNSAALEIPSLVKKPPSSYDDLLARAEKYVNLEDAQRYRRMENWPGGSRVVGAEKRGRKRGTGEREEDITRRRGKFSSHVPLDMSHEEVMEREGSASRSRPRSRPSRRRGQGPPWINQGVGEQRDEGRGQDVLQEPVEPRRRTNEDNHPTRGMIHMISGGFTDGDSRRAWKAHGRRLENFEISRGADLPQDPIISFRPEDLRGVVTPHNDALVVTATIVNYDVARIFIDNRSSVSVLFKSTLDQMQVEGFEFEPVSTPLYGFAGHAIPPLSQIVLLLSLGTDPRWVTKMIAFTVVDTLSVYNGFLG
ncbi:uncharacterized protein [Primulina eburnea]|uniref:uncharacterized protein n=1 Tax=Primulina eburnea TaxID=1245227 RepID=UPI003C6CAC1B